MILKPSTIKAFERHVLKEFPKEAVGFIINDEFVPVPNTAEEPTKRFKISPLHAVKAEACGTIQAILHSHPYDKFVHSKWPHEWPSTLDMTNWMRDTVPWGIAATCGEGISQLVWLDDSVIAPLEEREFIHGIQDCYSLVRDHFRINKAVTLKNFARGADWWNTGQNLYEDNFEAAGFFEVGREEATIDDVVLMKAASPVINHAAVIVGQNEILHHLFHRLSGRDKLSKWNRCISKVVRYKGTEC